MDWNPDDMEAWSRPEITRAIIGGSGRVTRKVARSCWLRVKRLRQELKDAWVLPDNPEWGLLTDWLLAALIARENSLLLGSPGVAKSEIATRTFQLVGLQKPAVNAKLMHQEDPDPYRWWERRCSEERQHAKYFHYQLSRFTQIEELFGPVEISLLRLGILVRINFAMITGAGVLAAFIDEIFKASGALLNSLLMLFNERTYFNWGGMMPSDLACVIAASNEMPGAFSGSGVAAGNVEDFHTLYALIDRLVVRFDVPLASGTDALAQGDEANVSQSSLSRATHQAIVRESRKFVRGSLFPEEPVACVNDLLLLGRAMMCDCVRDPHQDESIFELKSAGRFYNAFRRIGASLEQNATNLRNGNISWTISPRKLRALFKVARAYAVVTAQDEFGNPKGDSLITFASKGPPRALRVFNHIWDTPTQREALDQAVQTGCNSAWK